MVDRIRFLPSKMSTSLFQKPLNLLLHGENGLWGKMRINVADRIKNANKLKDLKIRRLSWIIKVGEM